MIAVLRRCKKPDIYQETRARAVESRVVISDMVLEDVSFGEEARGTGR